MATRADWMVNETAWVGKRMLRPDIATPAGTRPTTRALTAVTKRSTPTTTMGSPETSTTPRERAGRALHRHLILFTDFTLSRRFPTIEAFRTCTSSRLKRTITSAGPQGHWSTQHRQPDTSLTRRANPEKYNSHTSCTTGCSRAHRSDTTTQSPHAHSNAIPHAPIHRQHANQGQGQTQSHDWSNGPLQNSGTSHRTP